MAVIPGTRPEGIPLFKKVPLQDVIQKRRSSVAIEVDRLSREQVLRSNLDDLAASIVDEYRIDVPELHEDDIFVPEPAETTVDVSQNPNRVVSDRSRPFHIPGTSVTFLVPYTGDRDVFHYKASSFYPGGGPIAGVSSEALVFTYAHSDPDPEDLKRWFRQELDFVTEHLGFVEQDAQSFNGGITGEALKLLKARRDRLRQNADLATELGYPIQRRDDAPTTYAVPAKRRKVKVQRPRDVSGTTPAKLDPALLDDAYEDILEALGEIAQVMEYSPHAFRAMGEEDIRWVFVIPLNLAFEGEASGETFNYEGKTDILLRAEGRNVFIAECLIWSGPAYLTKKVDQLLTYTAWRDTKTALIIFNRNKNFSQVLDKIAPTIGEHPNFLRAVPVDGETVFRFVLSHRDDRERELLLTVLCFDVPGEESEPDE